MNYPFENVEHAIFQLAAFLDWGHIVLYLVGIMPFLGIAIDVILAKKIKKINALRFSILMTVTILASELPIYFCFVHKDFEVFWNTIHLK
jgi:hypothetical protein